MVTIFKELLGDRFCLMGNLIEVCSDGGGFILGSCCEIASNALFANIQALVNAGKKYGTYRK